MMKHTTQQLEDLARQIRCTTMRLIAGIGRGHVGGALSIAELLTVLYYEAMRIDPADPDKADRDRLVLSKGHAGPALYSVLAHKGYFPMEQVDTMNQPGTRLPSHCDMLLTRGIDMTTGSLGQGLSNAVGMALAARQDHNPATIYCIIGDGESQEGQIWEAGMYAAQMRLGNLIVFLDDNGLQIDGFTGDINRLDSAADKWRAFHWDVQEVDGHDCDAIYKAINQAKSKDDAPHMIVMKTIKGKGWAKIAGVPASHSLEVSKEDYEQFCRDLA